MDADNLIEVMRQCRRVPAEQAAIWRSPPAGEKHVSFERKRSSPPRFPPADAPGAHRFRLAPTENGSLRPQP
jgi:hypothetical protein